MKKGTLLVLLVVAGAAFLLWKKKEEDVQSGGPQLAQYPLFPQLLKDKVRSVRIDNLERSIQVKLERDAFGSWFMTDPLAYPALDPLVRTLLQNLELALGIAEVELSEEQIQLDPPRIVLELVQIEEAGERTLRLEIGGLDLDPSRVYVRIPDYGAGATGVVGKGETRLFRTVRSLYTTLDRNPDDYRERRATHLMAHQVTALIRRGEVFLEDKQERVDMRLDAQLDQRWVRMAGKRAFLSAEVLQLLARGAAELTVDLFRDDAPTDYAHWGLDPPAFTIELRDEDNDPTTLAFGHLPVDATDTPVDQLVWNCRREGFEHVWEVTQKSVGLLTRPLEDLLEYRLMAAYRREMVRVELERGGQRLLLEKEGREGAETWFVSEIPMAETNTGDEPLRYQADSAAVEDALAVIEGMELGNYPGLEGVDYEPGDDELSYTVHTVRDERFHGRLGAPYVDPTSEEPGRLFLFDTTELCGFAGEELAALCKRPMEEFRSLRIFRFGEKSMEAEVRRVELSSVGEGGELATLVFVNDGQNRWSAEGSQGQAPGAFAGAIDRGLLTQKARSWLAPDPIASRADSAEIRVRIHTSYDTEVSFALGVDAEGRSYCRTLEGQLAETNPGALEELRKLFSP